jgi:hypothetical protein
LGVTVAWWAAVISGAAAPIVATNITTALGPQFFFDAASTGGGDSAGVVFVRDLCGYWGSNDTVTFKGIGWASSSVGTVATQATVSFTDLGPDGVQGTGDDRLVGVVTDPSVLAAPSAHA